MRIFRSEELPAFVEDMRRGNFGFREKKYNEGGQENQQTTTTTAVEIIITSPLRPSQPLRLHPTTAAILRGNNDTDQSREKWF